MPYTRATAPDNVKGLPSHAQDIWIAAYNSASDNYDPKNDSNYDDTKTDAQNKERYANAIANAAVTKAGYSFDEPGAGNKVFAITDDHDWTGLADVAGASRFRKQIVKFGKWVDPFDPKLTMNLDRQWGKTVVKNFKDGVLGRIPVPLMHTDDPSKNKGELVDMIVTNDGVDGVIEIRDSTTALDIKEGRIWDVSIGFYDNYRDKATGSEVGPAIFHVALVNNPYLKDMKPFTALAQSERSSVIMLAEAHVKELSMQEVTNERDFAVEVTYEDQDGNEQKVTLEPGQKLQVPENRKDEVTKQITDAEEPSGEGGAGEGGAGSGSGSGEGLGAGEGAGSKGDEAKANEENQKLQAENEKLRKQLAERNAQEAYDKLLSEGRILPKQKETFMALATMKAEKIQLSRDGKKSELSISDAIVSMFEGVKQISLDESGNSGGEGDDKVEFSDEEQATFAKMGVDPKDVEEQVKAGTVKREEEESE